MINMAYSHMLYIYYPSNVNLKKTNHIIKNMIMFNGIAP